MNFEPLSYNSFRDSSVPSLDNSASNEVPVASEFSVLQKLSTLNTTKAQGLPDCLLKENIDLLTEPVTEILNTSYFENCLPSSWKEADVVPVPKQTPIIDVN